MHILILGASGFIGNAIFLSLVQDHHVTIAGRTPIEGYPNWRNIDFSKKMDINYLLNGVDLLINSIGIIKGDFKLIHTQVPIEIYKQCIKKNIKIIHISALGAEKKYPATPFLSTKKLTDNFLLGYSNAKIIYPGIVIGKRGKSTQFFAEISGFPIVPLFSERPLPFIHITQLSNLIQNIVSDFERYAQQIFAISEPEPLNNVLSAIKGKTVKYIKIPEFILSILFAIFPKISIGIFNKSTFKMYQTTSVTNYTASFQKVSKIINPKHVNAGDTFSQFFALLSISFIWTFSGISSLISWDESNALMSEITTNQFFSDLLIYLGSFADIILGVTVLLAKYRKKVLVLQLIFMLIYMLILTLFAPHNWFHPLGVLSKNIPLIALTYYLLQKK